MKKIVDGGTAATYAAYALSEMATVYPITPIAEMGEIAQKWAMKGITNFEGMPLEVREMESELGAAGATHGALSGGTLATTFTSSQGLMLMIPNMFKIAGELLPGVFHIGCRSVATHALSIFGDHSDVMATRTTGFAILMSASVQETHDLGIVAHLAAVDGRVPVLHGFDGFRTSNEMSTISMLPYADIFSLIDREKVLAFRNRSMNPEHPDIRGTAQNPDVYFQNREAANPFYDAFPAIVQRQMDRVGELTGRHYHLFDYVGDPQAQAVVISMGSSCEVAEETVAWLNQQGYKVGAVKVRLYRPFSVQALLEAIPQSVKHIAVLDRTKEPGALGEPLFTDVAAAMQQAGRDVLVTGGRYGLSSKEFDPTMVKAVFDNLLSENPLPRFTVGIDDDVTHLSLPLGEPIYIAPEGMIAAQFYGIGADGTVGATKQAAAIIGDTDQYYAQAYFQYSAKKSGGYTVSQLRIDTKPIHSEYCIERADYVACNKDTYVNRFELTGNLKPGGIFVLASSWTLEDMDRIFPDSLKRDIAQKKVKFYNVDAAAIAARHNLGVRINTIMETVFLHLMPIVPFDKAYADLQQRISEVYKHEGGKVVADNLAAIAEAVPAIQEIHYPSNWGSDQSSQGDTPLQRYSDTAINPSAPGATLRFFDEISRPCLAREGNSLPVSAFSPDGREPMGTTAYEKRRIALHIPQWDVDKCVECTECSIVCPHASIRPYLLSAQEKAAAPKDLITKGAEGAPALHPYQYRIQVYPDDCTGCSSCSLICPGHALTMVPIDTIHDQQAQLLDYCQQHVTIKDNLIPRDTINGSQFHVPCLEFSGACAGCGETPYVKLVTQLFGERMVIANATGCSSIWGADFPSMAYSVNQHGQGPAWGNSLFEDNAEYGYGMAVAMDYRRKALVKAATSLSTDPIVGAAASAWLNAKDDPKASYTAGQALVQAIKDAKSTSPSAQSILNHADMLGRKSVWAIGGDGWAYDIGFAGVDHVLAQNVDINLLVMDTECYSNTGGQMSKATPLSAVMNYAADGKRTYKKDLGRMMMAYGTVYVAQIALGGSYEQAIKALTEAEAYPGPSIVICYCPCIEHGIHLGLGHSILEEKAAVESGYWQLYRYNPLLAKEGKNPLTLDSPAPGNNPGLIDFINGEDRYADLRMIDPAEAAILQPALKARCDSLYDLLKC
ncbi:MAG: pyruvate:ferredoxin (flavodoxin) oxidoreductase [Bacteroidales bacterium]|nr:pyruvate:ferredoxin (flavodoxin) oxidoreductase [Bacteroidales bacterium]